MKLIFFVILYLFVIFFERTYQLPTSVLEQKALLIVKNNITAFLKDDQILDALGYGYTLLYNGDKTEDVLYNFTNRLLKSFDEDQQQSMVELVFKIMSNLGLDGVEIVIGKIAGAVCPVILPYMGEIQERMMEMKSLNYNLDDGINEGYSMTINFATIQVIEDTFCKAKRNFTDEEWNVIYPDINKFFLIDHYIEVCT